MNESDQLIIIGAGGHGLDVLFLAQRLGRPIKGFLDDNPAIVGSVVLGVPVLGSVETWHEHTDCEFVVAIGNPRIRCQIVTKMRRIGIPRFATLIDPVAVVNLQHVIVGKGSIIFAGAILTTQIEVGEHGIINLNATVAHQVRMGDFITIAPLAAISGCVTLGNLVEVGTNASIRQGVTMASGSMLGMGGVLTKDAEENAILIGNPAKVLRHLGN